MTPTRPTRLPILLALLALFLAAAPLPAADAPERGLGRVSIQDRAGQEVGFYRESHALLIGVSEYRYWPDLPGVVEDIAAVRRQLEAQGFRVVQVDNPDADALKAAYEDFIYRYGRRPGNRLLFYYAGHGHTEQKAWGGEMGYIVPADAPRPAVDPAAFARKALDMKQMEVYALNIDAKHALFLFDSCFSGSVFSVSRAIPKAISEKTARPVRQFITSGNADEEVPDHSTFRRQLVAALQGDVDGIADDGYITGRELGEYLQQSVVNLTNAAQHPQYGTIRHARLNKGDFVFRVPRPLPPPPPPPPPVAPGPIAPPPPPPMVGYLQVSVDVPHAEVRVNGRPAGTAARGKPLNLTRVPVGTVTVAVQAGDRRVERRETVRPRQWTQIGFQLAAVPEPPPPLTEPTPVEPPPTSDFALTVVPEPADARVRIMNIAPAYRDGIRLAPGRYRVRVDKPGYRASDQWIDIAAADRTLEVRLEPATPGADAAPGRTFRDRLRGGGLGPEMVTVPAGSFMMGSTNGGGNEKPVHRVRISQAFAIGKYEVTFDEYDRFCDATGRKRPKDQGWGRGRRPVINVSWKDATAYAEWLSAQTGQRYRLPTEAEWEYAARAGTTTEYWWGDAIGRNRANCDGCGSRWDNSKTAPVGSFAANPFGVHDTAGNVLEWVADWQAKYPSGTVTDPVVRQGGSDRGLRGGSWLADPRYLRAADRNSFLPWYSDGYLGFRLARTF